MRTILARLAYDGGKFAGYQFQPGQRTVQGIIEEALGKLHERPVATNAAGRTDAGVHATGQFITFQSDRASIPAGQFAAAINTHLPNDVAVLDSRAVRDGMHARFDAVSRHYRYQLVVAPVLPPHRRGFVWRLGFDPNIDRMNADAAALIGTHDFTTFAARKDPEEDMTRTMSYAHLTGRGNDIEFAIGGNGFLWRMVRSIVGTLVERERNRGGQTPSPAMGELLRARDRKLAGPTAPAWGLFLHDVEYEL